MRRRLITVLVLTLIGMPAIILGGAFYFLLMGTFLIGAAREFVQLYRAAKADPPMHIIMGGVAIILSTRMFLTDFAMPAFAVCILVALAYHLIQFERGRDQAAFDFGITTAGLVYLGWIGAYLLDIRNLPEGGWWFMLTMFCVWGGDSGAYSIGRAYGKHKLAPRLSPKKSWEGYAASVVSGALIGGFYVWVFQYFGHHIYSIQIWQGVILGLLLGSLPTLGDLGESMIKRQSGIKDSSEVIPGHGGFFDRIDSWLWGAVIGYYFIVWFIL